jgi:hypothetical protein
VAAAVSLVAVAVAVTGAMPDSGETVSATTGGSPTVTLTAVDMWFTIEGLPTAFTYRT